MRMKIGLTGSLGSGKSTVSEFLAELGCTVIDADALAREVTRAGTPAFREIVERFGDEVLSEEGELDRKALAEAAFSSREQLEALNRIVHPRVFARQREALEECGEDEICVVSIPLLFETGLENEMDAVVVVTVDDENRIERLRQSRGWPREKTEQILRFQMPQEEKAARADYVIDNNGSLEETRRQAVEILRKLKKEYT